jgi:purine nucleosidase
MPVILDVDTGVDDALALLYACASPELELVGVSCVAGNTALEHVVANTGTLLSLVGREDVEVSAGADRALLRPPGWKGDEDVHGPAGRGYARLSTAPVQPGGRDATQLLIDEARRLPGTVTLVATGPLTNVALAVRREPKLPQLLRRLTIMGGAFDGRGNTTPVAEYNIHADPEAARVVFDAFRCAPRRPVALGLDVTRQVRLGSDDIEEIARRTGDRLEVSPSRHWGEPRSPLMDYLAGALRAYAEFHHRHYGFYGTFLHDPLTVAATADPSLVTTRAVEVEVERTGEFTTGQTVADWEGAWGGEPNLDVAVDIQGEVALERIVERVASAVRGRPVEALPVPPRTPERVVR